MSESESNLIGAVLLAPERVLPLVTSLVVAADFSVPLNRAVWAAIVDLDADGEPVDEITVRQRMASLGSFVATPDQLAEMSGSVSTVENVEWHASAIARKAERRRWAKVAAEIAVKASGPDDDDDFFAAGEGLALQLSQQARRVNITSAKEALRKLTKRQQERYERHRAGMPLQGVQTGLGAVDSVLGPITPGTFCVVAGRPGMGKTSLGMNVVEHAARSGIGCLVFSLEMSTVSLWSRMVQSHAVSASALRTGNMSTGDWAAFTRAASDLAELPLWTDDVSDCGAIPIGQIRSRARRWRYGEGKGFGGACIVLDYLQLATAGNGKHESREREVAEVSRGFLALCKELDCSGIALAQLNRKVEDRTSKRPGMSDLRESGQIEQDAQQIAFIHRPVVYDRTQPERDAELDIAKNRDGETGIALLHWDARLTRFTDRPSDHPQHWSQQ